MRIRQILGLGLMAVSGAWAQGTIPTGPVRVLTVEQPDAQRTREELRQLLQRYPPALKSVLGLDPSLLSNQAYLAPYPALLSFLSAHPEIARNPSFYVGGNEGGGFQRPVVPDHSQEVLEAEKDVLGGLAGLIAFALLIGLLAWLVRTIIDYRRWNRLAKVQTDTHAKLLDRFTSNEDMLAYIQSPAGAKFLGSSPIMLDAGPRSVAAPLGRILWSVQAGVVLAALGFGLRTVSWRVSDRDISQPLGAMGVLGIALGLGFLISAIISFVISHRLGLIEHQTPRSEGIGAATGSQG
jgi:hypothetical protein